MQNQPPARPAQGPDNRAPASQPPAPQKRATTSYKYDPPPGMGAAEPQRPQPTQHQLQQQPMPPQQPMPVQYPQPVQYQQPMQYQLQPYGQQSMDPKYRQPMQPKATVTPKPIVKVGSMNVASWAFLFIGLLLFGGGLAATLDSYYAAAAKKFGGTYTIWWGPMLFGAIALFLGIGGIIQGFRENK